MAAAAAPPWSPRWPVRRRTCWASDSGGGQARRRLQGTDSPTGAPSLACRPTRCRLEMGTTRRRRPVFLRQWEGSPGPCLGWGLPEQKWRFPPRLPSFCWNRHPEGRARSGLSGSFRLGSAMPGPALGSGALWTCCGLVPWDSARMGRQPGGLARSPPGSTAGRAADHPGLVGFSAWRWEREGQGSAQRGDREPGGLGCSLSTGGTREAPTAPVKDPGRGGPPWGCHTAAQQHSARPLHAQHGTGWFFN